MSAILQVALGGAIGATARYAVVLAALRVFGSGFPLGTLAVNLCGSLLMGMAIAWFEARGHMVWAMPFVTVGLLGGFTTFSAFSLEVVALIEQGRAGVALVYMGASVAGAILALVAGLTMVRMVIS